MSSGRRRQAPECLASSEEIVPFTGELNRTGTGSSAEATVEDNRVFTRSTQLDFHPSN
jgi:hypothetical protein